MADNYLEKKFEEYAAAKAGKRPARRLSPSGQRQGVVEMRFPRRRVMVALREPLTVVEAFAGAGCQVAFCGTDPGLQATAERVGAQFHPVERADVESLGAAMDKAFSAWRDIEILISDADNAASLSARWSELRGRLPMAPDYGRMIAVGDADAGLPEVAHATVNRIVGKSTAAATATTCLFLSLPDSEAIDGQTIEIKG